MIGMGKVNIGEVMTFPHPKADKEQVMKIAEEEHEVFSAWEKLEEIKQMRKFNYASWAQVQMYKRFLMNECADLITATANLLDALGVDDMRGAMKACEERNRQRGRL